MTRMINAFTGTEMWVADDRIEEYKAAGHLLPSVSEELIVQEEAIVEAKVEEIAEPAEEKPAKPKATKSTKASTKKK